MAGGRSARGAQQSKLEKFAFSKVDKSALTTRDETSSQDPVREEQEDPTLKDIMTAIQGVKGILEGKIDSVST